MTRFGDQDFAVSVRRHDSSGASLAASHESALSIVAERLRDGQLWSGDLTEAYIHDLTSKTGAAKKPQVLASMLESGLTGVDSVRLELLTSAELEALKRRRTGTAPAAPPLEPGPGKRYLVVTHSPAFDSRVHYPLPLQPVAGPVAPPPSARLLLERLRGPETHTAAPDGARHELEQLHRAHSALQRRCASEVAALTAELTARRESETAWRLKSLSQKAELEALQRRLRATEARVGLRGGAASANFTYSLQNRGRSLSVPHSGAASPYRSASPAWRPPRESREKSHSRPASASPARARFDPTAYAEERRLRIAAAEGARRERSPSPAGWGSRAASPRPHWRPAGAAAARAESPGAALREVKARLGEFTRRAPSAERRAGDVSGRASPRMPPVVGGVRPAAGPPAPAWGGAAQGAISDEPEAAIAEIDARLARLSEFLRAAKASE